MKAQKKVCIQVTPKQLEDLVTCVGWALSDGLGYGHVTMQEQALLESHRKRLYEKLQKLTGQKP